MMPGVNFVIYGCSYARARPSPGVSLYWSLTLDENNAPIITQNWVIDENLKRQDQRPIFVYL